MKSLYLGTFVKIITVSWLTLWLSELMDGNYRNSSLTKTLGNLMSLGVLESSDILLEI